MDILVSAGAFEQFGPALRAASPAAGWLVMGADGTLRRGDGAQVDRDDARPEVAWGTYDLFDSDIVRPFFGLCARSESLRWFASPAAGFENPFFAQLLERGVRLTTGHGTAPAIAEYVLRAVLDAFQPAAAWRAAQAERRWQRSGERFREVLGSRWLVYGLGHIGTEVAVRARALGATVVGVRRSPHGGEPVDELRTPDRVDAELLGSVDVVVLTAAANAGTRGLVDAAFLGALGPEVVLVNVARGELVDEAALAAALDAGWSGRVVLDVTAVEPLPSDSPLWGDPRVTITPHTSGHSRTTNARLLEPFLENLGRYERGEPLRDERTPADV